MNFIEAMIKLEKNQGYVRRAAWRGNLIKQHIVKYNGTYYHNYDNHYYNFEKVYEFTSVEYLANDWEIYEEQPKLHTFEEALKAYKQGKKIIRKIVDWDDNEAYWDISSKDDYVFQKEDVMANDWIIEGDKI